MNETFGQRFARLRKAKGLKQEEIANALNISAQAVSKWENDISSPDISILNELADILEVSLDELLGKQKEHVTEVLPAEERKSIDKMILKIIVSSHDGDKVNVKLPLAIVKVCIESGISMPQVSGNKALQDIDFKKIFDLVQQGVIGELISVDSADGDHVVIRVE